VGSHFFYVFRVNLSFARAHTPPPQVFSVTLAPGRPSLSSLQNAPFEVTVNASVRAAHPELRFASMAAALRAASCFCPACGAPPQHTCMPGYADTIVPDMLALVV